MLCVCWPKHQTISQTLADPLDETGHTNAMRVHWNLFLTFCDCNYSDYGRIVFVFRAKGKKCDGEREREKTKARRFLACADVRSRRTHTRCGESHTFVVMWRVHFVRRSRVHHQVASANKAYSIDSENSSKLRWKMECDSWLCVCASELRFRNRSQIFVWKLADELSTAAYLTCGQN